MATLFQTLLVPFALLLLLPLGVGCSAEPQVPPDSPATDDEAEDDDEASTADEASADDESAVRDAATPPRRDASIDASVGRGADASRGRQDARASTTPDDSAAASDASSANEPPDSTPPVSGTCPGLPEVSDYGATGPFEDAKAFANVGPGNNYTVFRPDASLGRDGFKHPVVVWGNGIATTPNHYTKTLTLIASHGFVVVACNDTMAERPCLNTGIEWLISQNESGPMQGKLDTTNEATLGYSWGGGAAIDTANRPNVRATASLHGMPPRLTSAFADMHAPLLLYTSTGDGFVTAEGYVTPNYEKAKVQTFYATLMDDGAGHLYVVDEGSTACAVSGALGECEGAIAERAPTVAWLRLWQCGDESARAYFYGDDCTLCQAPWTKPQRKNWPDD